MTFLLLFKAARYYPCRRFACRSKLIAQGINMDIAHEVMTRFAK